MDGFFVDLSQLYHAAESVQQTGGRVGENSVHGYAIAANSVGHDGLAAALADFDQGSRHAAKAMSESMAETATRMRAAVTAYQNAETAARSAMAECDQPGPVPAAS